MEISYLGVLVRSLLPFLGHGLRHRASKGADDEPQTSGDRHVLDDLDKDAETFTLGSFSAGTVGTEGNPVGCEEIVKLAIDRMKASWSHPAAEFVANGSESN